MAMNQQQIDRWANEYFGKDIKLDWNGCRSKNISVNRFDYQYNGYTDESYYDYN